MAIYTCFKILLRLVTTAVLSLALALSGCSQPATPPARSPALPDGAITAVNNGQKVYKIGLTQFATHPAADAGRQGFKDALKDGGFTEGQNIFYDYQNPEGDSAAAEAIAAKFVSEKADLIFSFGTGVSQAAVKTAAGTGIPVLFCSVTDPVKAGLIKNFKHAGENVSGTSDMIEMSSVLDMIRQIVPGIKKLGTLYNPAEQNSLVLNDKLKALVPSLGISMVEETVAGGAEVPAASQKLAGRVDAVWIGTDNTVVTGLSDLIRITRENRIPFFPSDDASVKAGGIACLGFDDYAIGYQTGQMAVKILRGTPAEQIPAESGRKLDYTVNLKAAGTYGVSIPQAILDQAVNIYK
jgi:putative tryptophan/tyrosine transport system substrate-binding protein